MRSDSFQLSQDLITKAAMLEQTGDHTLAKSFWQEAEQSVASLPRCALQVNITRHLVKALAKAGYWQEAECVLITIQALYWRERTVRSVAKIYVEAGLWQEAERITTALPDGSYRMVAVRNLARDLAQARKFQDAERLALSVTDTLHQVVAFYQIAMALAKAGRQSQAESMRQKASDRAVILFSQPAERGRGIEALHDLCTAFTQAGLWLEAEQVATSITTHVYERSLVLRGLATALIRARLWPEAERIATAIAAPFERAAAFLELALDLTKKRQPAQAHRVWQAFEGAVSAIPHPSSHDWMLEHSVIKLTRFQQWQEAEQIAISISTNPYQTRALDELVNALTRAHHWRDAERVKHLLVQGSNPAN